MTKGEGESSIDPVFFTAVYWNGHEPGDECGPTEVSKSSLHENLTNVFKERAAVQEAGKILNSKDRGQGQTALEPGTIFQPLDYAAGTVVILDREVLQGIGPLDKLSYKFNAYFGVVSESPVVMPAGGIVLFDAAKVLSNKVAGFSESFMAYEYIHEGPITIGGVVHEKVTGDQELTKLSRTSNMLILGSGRKSRSAGRVRIPRLRAVFPRPHPGMT